MDLKGQKLCAELWQTYESQLHRLCRYQMKKYPDDADDVVSEVYLALCKKVADSGPPEHPKAWLYGTLNNLMAAKFKQIYKAAERQVSMEDMEQELPFDDDFEEIVHDRVVLSNLKKRLEQELNDSEKQLLEYIYTKEKSLREIAELTGSTTAAVKQKHYRLVKKIKKISKNF